jgi:aminoglycoside phosphotransferase (APT) family kinase protein
MNAARDEAFQQIARRIDPRGTLTRAWPLTGGVSAQVTALEIARPDGLPLRAIVRQHGPADLQHNPHIAADEFRLLSLLRERGLAVPNPYHYDESGALLPGPYIAIEFVDGAAELPPGDNSVRQMAAQLARIHAIDGADSRLAFLPRLADGAAAVLAARGDPSTEPKDARRIRGALAGVWPIPERNRLALLHGDFWPGNMLWRAGQLAAVIDWEDASVGDTLADLANSRLELMWALGRDAMELFTREYLAVAAIDTRYLPDWELYAALKPAIKLSGWGLEPDAEAAMRDSLRWFVGQAIEQIEQRA